MKIRISLILLCLLITGILAPSGKAQKQEKNQEPEGRFTIHTSNSTSYYSTSDRTLYLGVQYLQKIKTERNKDEISGKFEIGLYSRLNPKIDPKINIYGAPVRSVSKTYPSYIIPDSSAVVLVALGIARGNVKDYKYRVVKNDSIEVVPWSPIPSLEKKYGAEVPYGAIGTFRSPGDIIMVEVVNTKDYSIRDGVIYDWRVDYKPRMAGLSANASGNYYELLDLEKSKNYAKKSTDGSFPVQLRFPADSLLGMGLRFRHHETIPYDIFLEKMNNDSVAESAMLKSYLQDDYCFADHDWLRKPGKYRYKIVRAESIPGQYDKTQALYIPFEIKPPPPPTGEKKVSLKQTLPYIIATLSGVALLFFIYYRRNQVKLKTAGREKQMAALKLKSIRSQLNPHFMFNALTSIQNLINKNDIKGANYYLSIFSGLTRQVLDSNNEELLSLEEELKILDDYLQMEQLRFGFQYEIQTDEDLNQANIEIPAMLLQPFVENAVKHGISGMKQEGRIRIIIRKENQDLVLSVTDNGKGFVPDPQSSGYGLKLSRERVELLNQIYKDQSLTLTIAAHEGSTITLRLLNWIS